MVPGTKVLAETVADKLSKTNCRAILLQNHGLVVVGKDFQDALNVAEEIDEAARVFVLSNGKAGVIPREYIDKI